MSALSRTIRPYSRACPAAGTHPASSSIAAGPPICSSRPSWRSASATVRWSILRDVLVQPQHRREHESVLLAVEVLGAQLLVGHQRVEVTLVEQHGAEHGLLGLEVVRRHRELLGRERVWSCGGLLLVVVDVGELRPQLGVLAFDVAHGLLTEDGPADLVHEPDEQRAVPGQLGEGDRAAVAAVTRDCAFDAVAWPPARTARPSTAESPARCACAAHVRSCGRAAGLRPSRSPAS